RVHFHSAALCFIGSIWPHCYALTGKHYGKHFPVLLVILGAGASYDSLEPLRGVPNPNRPPLAAELFDDREAFRRVAESYTEPLGLFPWLRKQGADGSIEAAFDTLQKEAEEKPQRVRQLAAIRFYIRDAI